MSFPARLHFGLTILSLSVFLCGANAQVSKNNLKPLRGEDVLATVEGEPITRREFTAFWLKVDNQASRPLGAVLAGAFARRE